MREMPVHSVVSSSHTVHGGHGGVHAQLALTPAVGAAVDSAIESASAAVEETAKAVQSAVETAKAAVSDAAGSATAAAETATTGTKNTVDVSLPVAVAWGESSVAKVCRMSS